MKPLVSILFNCYNGEKYIVEQLKSIYSQTYSNWELIIYDDCSTDNTLKLVQRIINDDPRVKIVKNNKNLGLLESFRRGMKLVKGDYICLADNDNYWLSTRLEKEVDYLNQHPKELMVFHDSFISNQNLGITSNSFTKSLNGKFWSISSFNTNDLSLENLLDNNQVTGISIMFRNCLNKSVIQIPDDEMHDGWIAKLSASNGKIGYISEPLIIYRQHQSNYVGTLKNSNKFYFSAITKPEWQEIYTKKANLKIKSLNLLKKLIPKNQANYYFINRKIKFYQLAIKIYKSNFIPTIPSFISGIIFSFKTKYYSSIKYFIFFYLNRNITIIKKSLNLF